jgi:peptidoglycan/xylan/chitin deacetylase (PgdA/CDA1 family)
MSSENGRPALFGRRQLLLGGGTFVAGMVGVTAWTETRPKKAVTASSSSTTPATAPPDTTSPADPMVMESVPDAQPLIPAETSTTVTNPPDTSSVPGSSQLAVSGPATSVNHGPTTVNNIALTFHLGGDPTLVGELLDVLKANGITSTLFAIGDWLTAHPQLGHRAVADGHELGNHTKSHQSMLKLSRADVHAEIVGGGQALVPFIGSIGTWFRPSGTDVPTDLILEEAGLAGYAVSVGYDIDSRDYTEPGAAAVVARVKKELHAGAIVSLHFGHRDTIDAMPQILGLVTAAGLTPVTVTGLLG